MVRLVFACLLPLALAAGAVAQETGEPVPEPQLRAAAEKAFKPIEHSQRVWNKNEQMCTSCHHQHFPILAAKLARTRGIAIDGPLAGEIVANTFARLRDLDMVVQGLYYIDITDDALLLTVAEVAGVRRNLATDAHAQFLVSSQRSDGSWYTMDARPPQTHSRFTVTALSARAVAVYLPERLAEEKRAVIGRARGWLLKTQPRTNEDRISRLLGLGWTGADAAHRKQAAQQLIAEQRPDGSWSQLPSRDGDAYATGAALHALHEATGLPTSDPVYQRGLRFLLKTQQADGSWRVESRLHPPAPVSPPYFNAEFPHGRRHQFISIMGSTWATVSILQAIPPKSAKASPAALDFAPTEKEEWLDIALNGSAQDLKKALDGGMKPNARTAKGTTALMLAARDPAKVKLLIERGADVNARAASGFTALMVAARHRGNAESLRLLLDAGAEVNAGQDVTVVNDATVLFHAATTGDTKMTALLLDRGAKIDRPTRVLGMMSMTPLVDASLRGDLAMVKHLLDRGADPTREDEQGMVPLDVAVLTNHADVVRLLLSRGARVNHVDKLGMTPLLYAASIDFGDTAVVEKLLAAGADIGVKNETGRTALDLARAYKHPSIARLLEGKIGPR